MANVIKGLLPSGKAPTVLKAEIIELIKTEAPAPDLTPYATKEELEKKTIGVPIFQTLAEAQDWEAQNPGKIALTLEPSTPDVTPPTAGTLTVSPSGTSAILAVSGASDDRRITGYAFKIGNGAWSPWQDSASYTAISLTPSTSYTFQHKVKDAAGNETTGPSVTASTTKSLPIGQYRKAVMADAPFHYLPLSDSASSTTLTNLGSSSQSINNPGFTFGEAGIGDEATAAKSNGTTALSIPVQNLKTGFTIEWIIEGDAPPSDHRVLEISSSAACVYYPDLRFLAYFGTGVGDRKPVQRRSHIAITYSEDGNITTYIDGLPVGAATNSSWNGSATATFKPLRGSVAGVAYFTKALTPERIKAHAVAAGV